MRRRIWIFAVLVPALTVMAHYQIGMGWGWAGLLGLLLSTPAAMWAFCKVPTGSTSTSQWSRMAWWNFAYTIPLCGWAVFRSIREGEAWMAAIAGAGLMAGALTASEGFRNAKKEAALKAREAEKLTART